MEILVQKRNGKLVEFNPDKIKNAILKAMKKVNEVNESAAESITRRVTNEIEDDIKANNKEYIQVEEIQDLVENGLTKNKYISTEVIREYMTYRFYRANERTKENKLMKICQDIIDIKNIDINHENANLNGSSYAGKQTKFGSEMAKEFALSKLIKKEYVDAHNERKIHIHDLDNYANGCHNCTFIDMGRLLARGYHTGNGSVRPANSLEVAFSLVPIIFQSQQNCEFGGVATDKLDYDLAPYVKKSFINHFAKAIFDYRDFITTDNYDYLFSETIVDNDFNNFNSSKDIAEFLSKKYSSIIIIDNKELEEEMPFTYGYAYKHTVRECNQGAQGLIHNLNTMCSRAGKI